MTGEDFSQLLFKMKYSIGSASIQAHYVQNGAWVQKSTNQKGIHRRKTKKKKNLFLVQLQNQVSQRAQHYYIFISEALPPPLRER